MQANGSEYRTDPNGTEWQFRKYFLCKETLEVIPPHNQPLLLEGSMQLVIPQLSKMGEDCGKVSRKIFILKKVCLPANWLPGICDRWVELNAVSAFKG